ncbi:MAG: NAD(P)H-dependent glycerol-3-phosphate dehydrogenase [Myxococcota bacterium]
MKREPVAVIGGGAWGTMLAHLLSINNSNVKQWVRDAAVREEMLLRRTHSRSLPGLSLSPRIEPLADLDAVARSAHVLVVAVPSRAFREVMRRLGDTVQGDQMVIWGTKGLEEGTGRRMSEIVLEETCVRMVGALAGPAYADELKAGQPGALVIGSRFESVVERVQKLLSSEQLRVYGNEDLMGVELGSGLSTIIALVCGLAQGMGMGAGIRSVVLNRGLVEITRLGQAMGADEATFNGLAVLGDMTSAVMAGISRSHRLGEKLAQGLSLQEALQRIGPAECVPTTRVAFRLVKQYKVEAPLIEAMHAMLFEGQPHSLLLKGLMTRRSTYE